MAERTHKCMCGRKHPISTIGKTIDHETGKLIAPELAAEQERVNRVREWLRDNEGWEPNFDELRTILAEGGNDA